MERERTRRREVARSTSRSSALDVSKRSARAGATGCGQERVSLTRAVEAAPNDSPTAATKDITGPAARVVRARPRHARASRPIERQAAGRAQTKALLLRRAYRVTCVRIRTATVAIERKTRE